MLQTTYITNAVLVNPEKYDLNDIIIFIGIICGLLFILILFSTSDVTNPVTNESKIEVDHSTNKENNNITDIELRIRLPIGATIRSVMNQTFAEWGFVFALNRADEPILLASINENYTRTRTRGTGPGILRNGLLTNGRCNTAISENRFALAVPAIQPPQGYRFTNGSRPIIYSGDVMYLRYGRLY